MGNGITRHVKRYIARLTHSQIINLVGTSAEVLPAPHEGYDWSLLSMDVWMNPSLAAYTNIDVGSSLKLEGVQPFAAIGSGLLDNIFGNPLARRHVCTGLFSYPSVAAAAAIKLVLNNGSSGELTGGHADSILNVAIYASQVPLVFP